MAKSKKPTADSILNEFEKALRTGVPKTMKIEKAAKEFWRARYKVAIQERLDNGGDWEAEKKNPLRVAKKLGKVSAALANGKVIEKWAAEASAVAIKANPLCGGGGMGLWCEV